jgi:DNA-binding IscR family transcriptional regulator
VACAEKPEHESACEFQSKCQIHGMMRGLNARMKSFLSSIRLSEFTTESISPEPIQLENFSKQVNS